MLPMLLSLRKHDGTLVAPQATTPLPLMHRRSGRPLLSWTVVGRASPRETVDCIAMSPVFVFYLAWDVGKGRPDIIHLWDQALVLLVVITSFAGSIRSEERSTHRNDRCG